MFAIREKLEIFAVLVPWRPQFWPERKMTEVLSYWFFNHLSNAAFHLSLRRSGAELDGGRIPPPPPGRLCYNRSTGSARVNIDILLAKLIKPEKTKTLTLNWPVTSSVTSKSNTYLVRIVHVRRAIEWRLKFENRPSSLGDLRGPFAPPPPPIRTCCQPVPIVARVKRQQFPFTILQKKTYWFQQYNLLPMPSNQPFTFTETVSVC